jgi:hypothetical protein
MDSKDQATSRLQKLDVYSKLLLGVVGAMITFILGVGQYNLARSQQQFALQQTLAQSQIAKQQTELQTLEMVRNYLNLIDEPGEKGKRAREIVQEAARYLSDEYGNPFIAVVAEKLKIARTESASLQIVESTAPPPLKDGWYAVVASFREFEKDRAVAHAENLSKMIAAQDASLKVEIYQTSVSRVYAVTIGGKQDRTKALELANWARGKGLASDAFAQIDRDWIRVDDNP